MKKMLLIFAIISVSTIQLSVNAFDFSSFLKKSTSQTMQQSSSNVDTNKTGLNSFSTLENQINNANTQTQTTFLNLVSMLSSKQDADIIQYKINNIMNNNNTTATEKSSLITQIMKNYKNDITGIKSSEAISAIKNMQTSDRQKLINTVANLAQNGSSYFALAKNYTKTASTMAKASSTIQETANALSTAKQAASSLKENAEAITILTSSISSLVNQAGIN